MSDLPTGRRYTDEEIASTPAAVLMGRARAPLGQRAVREQVLWSGPCTYCGDSNPTHVDHVIPVTKFGTGDLENLVPACSYCNLNKLDFTPEEWRDWRLSEGMEWPPKTQFEVLKEAFHRILAEKGLTPEEFHAQRAQRSDAA